MPVIDQEKLAVDIACLGQMTYGQAEAAVRLFGELVVRAVSDGYTVELPAFGKFDLGERGNGEPALRFRQATCVREALKS